LVELSGRQLRITVRAAFPTYLLDILIDTVDFLIKSRWPGLKYRWSVPCLDPDCAGTLNVEALLRRREDEQTKANCPECGQDWPLDKLLIRFPEDASLDEAFAQIDALMSAPSNSEYEDRVALILRTLRKGLSDQVPRWLTLADADKRDSMQSEWWCESPGHEHAIGANTEEVGSQQVLNLLLSLRNTYRNSEEDRLYSDHELLRGNNWEQLKGQRKETPLRRVRAPDGERLWVCEKHYPLYDPQLPKIPQQVAAVEKSIRPFTLESIHIRNFRNIEDLEIPLAGESDLDGNWTCLAGINGAGKTAILEAIALVLLGADFADQVGGGRLARMIRRKDGKQHCAEITLYVKRYRETTRLYLPLAIDPDGGARVDRASIPHNEAADAEPLRRELRKHLFVSYGATRNLSDRQDLDDGEDSPLVERQRTLFQPLAQIPGISGLVRGGEENMPKLVTACALLREVLDVEGIEVLKPEPDQSLSFAQWEHRLDAFQLPDGYRSTIAWLADLCSEWHNINPDAAKAASDAVGLAKMSGVVLVDEIDLHLHPALQRSLVPKLRRILPNVQFVVTTHSPMVLASFDRNELILLEQDKGGLGIREIDRQIFGFSMNEIYKWLLGTNANSPVIEELIKQGEDPEVLQYLYVSPETDGSAAKDRLQQRKTLLDELRGEQKNK
jgi:predicted ATPase